MIAAAVAADDDDSTDFRDSADHERFVAMMNWTPECYCRFANYS